MVHADSTGTGRIWVLHVGPQPWPRNGTFASDSIYTVIPTCKAKRQYPLTLQASKYYLLALKNSMLGLYLIRVGAYIVSFDMRDVPSAASGEKLNQCWFDAGPASQTLDQYRTNIGSTSRVCEGGFSIPICHKHRPHSFVISKKPTPFNQVNEQVGKQSGRSISTRQQSRATHPSVLHTERWNIRNVEPTLEHRHVLER